jgi:multidrug resistance efflux pump
VRFALLVITAGSMVALVSYGQALRGPAAVAANPGVAKPVDRSDDRIAADGVVEGARPEAALRPDVAGTLAAIHVRESQRVKRGQLLAELTNETQSHQVALAEAELAIAKAQLAKLKSGERAEKRRAAAAAAEARVIAYRHAQGALERTRRLWENRSISRDEYDRDFFASERARAEMEESAAESALADAPPRPEEVAEAEAKVAAAAARLRLAQAELARTRIVAPTDGQVLRVFAEPGEAAGPARDSAVLLMADLSHLRVRAFVEELDATRVRVGQTATVTTDGLPGRAFVGKVTQVAPRMGRRAPQNDNPGEYKDLYYREVMIDPEDANELPLNLRVQTRIQAEDKEPVAAGAAPVAAQPVGPGRTPPR